MTMVGFSTWPPRAMSSYIAFTKPKPLRFGETGNNANTSPPPQGEPPPGGDKPCTALVVYDPAVVIEPRVKTALLAAQQITHPFIRRGCLAAALEQAERLGDWNYLKTQVTLAVADNLLNTPYHTNEKADETEHRFNRALTLLRGIKAQCLQTAKRGLNDLNRPLTIAVLLRMGHAYYGLNQLDDAEEHYRGVVATVPSKRTLDSTPPMIELGEAYLGLSKIAKQDTRLEEALEYSEKSLAVLRVHPLGWARVRALSHHQDILSVLGDNNGADAIGQEITRARQQLKRAAA